MNRPIATDKIVEALKSVFHSGEISNDAETLAFYGRDHTKIYQPDPSAVVFPKSIQQVQELVKLANHHQFPLVPSGGRTGLSGGACACNHEVVVSFDKMNQNIELDKSDALLKCQAGAVTQTVKEAAAKEGLHYPVDFASKGSSQIGGNIATNAGGVNVVRYGPTRNWVAGLTVVTGNGEVMTLNRGLIKNATGYDLRQLWIGSEGTLGFVVEATLWLTYQPKPSQVMVLGVSDVQSIIPLFHQFKSKLVLNAFEFFSDQALNIVVAKGKAVKPFQAVTPYYVLIDFECEQESTLNTALKLFESSVEAGWVADGVISQNSEQIKSLWALRESISESLASFKPHKNDLSVRVAQMPTFSRELLSFSKQHYPGFEVILFGHIGDGNIHVNILKPENLDHDIFVKKCLTVDKELFKMTEKFGGSISAEHGVGLLKKAYLHYSRSFEEISNMKAIKKIFDPKGIMNPGKIFD